MLSDFSDKNVGESGDSLFPPGETEVFGGGGFHTYAVGGYFKTLSHTLAHILYVWCQFGGLCADGDIHVSYPISHFMNESFDIREEEFAVYVLEFLVVVGEIVTYVA
jgi:hypothetical protein